MIVIPHIQLAVEKYAKDKGLTSTRVNGPVGAIVFCLQNDKGATIEKWDTDNLTLEDCQRLPQPNPIEFGYQLINNISSLHDARAKDKPQIYMNYTKCANVKVSLYLKAYYAAYK